MHPLFLVGPTDADRPTGGNLYNHYLCRALTARGVAVTPCSLDAYRTARTDDPPRRTLVDSLYVEALHSGPRPPPQRGAEYFLMHYLPSMLADAPGPMIRREARTLARFDGIIATSALSRAYIETRLGIDPPVWVVEPACGLAPPEERAFSPTVRALAVANLVPNKGLLPLLDALAPLADETPSWHLTLVGRSDLHPAYARTCLARIDAHPGLRGRVGYEGAVAHADLPACYAAHNVFVSASQFETYGMALHEARVMGLPVLTLRHGHAPHHVREGHTGHVCDDVPALASCLRHQAAHPEAFLRLQQSAWAARPDRAYSWDDAAGKLLDALGISV